MLEYVNLALLNNAKAYQLCTTNKSYKTGNNNARIYITANC